MLRITWSAGTRSGTASLDPGGTFVVVRRMNLPEAEPVQTVETDGSTFLMLRLPYVSDPALVVRATAGQPVVHRGQRANGAVVELTPPHGDVTSPAPGQSISLTESGTRIDLRYPDLQVCVTAHFDRLPSPRADSGTVQLGVDSLQHDDSWLVAAIAVALSPDHGVVSHGRLKAAFAQWRGVDEPSDGTFDRNVLRPALEARTLELPGARLNKIVYLVERCRRTAEFPEHVLEELRRQLGD
ncbi:hypothetical protein HMPREF0063_10969 [Aeromicrobium marinum DSM 15272]|uniref:Uncharacterized protein n=1 Tax=Aeromicrobium marinum DSM 15272 TaxID=585531 RepID=E2SAH9_9ACTN|nr:hypothetical protein HMPREF0063_10969 [Aeromicrobium marinum DSM 15272]